MCVSRVSRVFRMVKYSKGYSDIILYSRQIDPVVSCTPYCITLQSLARGVHPGHSFVAGGLHCGWVALFIREDQRFIRRHFKSPVNPECEKTLLVVRYCNRSVGRSECYDMVDGPGDFIPREDISYICSEHSVAPIVVPVCHNLQNSFFPPFSPYDLLVDNMPVGIFFFCRDGG